MEPTELTQIARKFTYDLGPFFLVYNIPYIFIYVYSDYDLNAICHETCIDEALECIMSCDSTDSTCLSDCLRAEDSCGASKNFHIRTWAKMTQSSSV